MDISILPILQMEKQINWAFLVRTWVGGAKGGLSFFFKAQATGDS